MADYKTNLWLIPLISLYLINMVLFLLILQCIKIGNTKFPIGGHNPDADDGKLQVHLKNNGCICNQDELDLKISQYGFVICSSSWMEGKTNNSKGTIASASGLELTIDSSSGTAFSNNGSIAIDSNFYKSIISDDTLKIMIFKFLLKILLLI